MVNVNCGPCGHLNTKGDCNLTACIFPCNFGTGGYVNKLQTNADRIRSMSDEELATYLNDMQGLAYINGFDSEPIHLYPNNYGAWLKWLKQEVEKASDELHG